MQDLQMKAMSKVGLALVVAVLLLFNSAGQCAKVAPSTSSTIPSHCHKPPAPAPEDCGTASCVYMDALPLATAVSIGHDPQPLFGGPVLHKPIAEQLRVTDAPAFHVVILALHQRFLTIHQLLI